MRKPGTGKAIVWLLVVVVALIPACGSNALGRAEQRTAGDEASLGDRPALDRADTGRIYPLAVDPLLWAQEAKLFASDATPKESFGVSVAVSGDTAIVGASADDDNGPYSGSAYVFVRNGNVWAQQAKLLAGDGAPFDGFGISVDISGDTAVVGASVDDDNGSNSGSAYVFVRNGSTWTQQAKLLAGDGATEDYFGEPIAISGDTVVAGAFGQDAKGTDAGAAYVFVRNGNVWTQQAKLLAGDGAAGDWFGVSARVSGDTAVVGAEYGNNLSGAAYVFVRNGVVWAQQAKLLADDGKPAERFGASVALSGDTVVVGAKDGIGWNADSTGAAYVFVRGGVVWTQQAKLFADDGKGGDRFGGESIAVSGDTVMAGTSDQAGAVYAFTRNGAAWTQQAKLLPGDAKTGISFGSTVALSGDTVMMGAYHDNEKGSDSGSAYVYHSLPPLDLGGPCTGDLGCLSGFCADGVCCDTACGGSDVGDCQACSVAAGAMKDGVCWPLAAGTLCRAANGVCDAAETCSGASAACPADSMRPAGTVCRAAAGACDEPEACDGATIDCPSDATAANGTSCPGGACLEGLCAGGMTSSGSGSSAGSSTGGAPPDASDNGGCACGVAGARSPAGNHGQAPPAESLLLLALAWTIAARRLGRFAPCLRRQGQAAQDG